MFVCRLFVGLENVSVSDVRAVYDDASSPGKDGTNLVNSNDNKEVNAVVDKEDKEEDEKADELEKNVLANRGNVQKEEQQEGDDEEEDKSVHDAHNNEVVKEEKQTRTFDVVVFKTDYGKW